MDHDPKNGPVEQKPRGLGRRARWAAPAVALLATGGVIAGTAVAGARAAPSLPARNAATLLADVQRATGPGPMTATIQETANLGLPALPGGADPASALSLLSGSHTFRLWYADPAHVRLAQQVQLGESDLRVNGRQVWLWNSKSQTATHVVLPSHRPERQRIAGPDHGQGDGGPPLTPEQAARRFLALVGPTTTVSVQRNVSVAGRNAYQLSLAPKDSRSQIGQIRIALDAAKYYPLRVQVFARGTADAAFQIGYTSLTLGRPAESNFAFTPPPGAKVKTVTPTAGAQAPRPWGYMPGRHHGFSSSSARLGPHGSLYAKPMMPGSPVAEQSAHEPASSGPMLADLSVGGLVRHTVMGKGWLSVLVLQRGLPLGDRTAFTTHGSHSSSYSSPGAFSGSASAQSQLPVGNGPGAEILAALLRAATPVHGPWGSGHLLRTSLVNVLITRKGAVLIGAVTPSVLYADAAAVK